MLAEVLGYAAPNDAYHMCVPLPSGRETGHDTTPLGSLRRQSEGASIGADAHPALGLGNDLTQRSTDGTQDLLQ